jgi:hypothetical protein
MRSIILFVYLSLFLFGCKTEEPQNPPTVITKVASDVSLKNATLNGEVTDEGFSAASERGFVFSDKNTNPSVSDTKIQSGYGKGVFSIVLDKLPVNTKYYYKAFATNTKGTSYGEVQNFTTADYSLASLTTETPKNITFNSVEVGGNVSNEGGGNVTERGFCFGLNPNPTTSENKLSVSTKGLGSFALVIINLKENTKYYIRSYAINEKGTSYGNEQIFTTLDFKLPTITTGEVTNITFNSVTANGNLVDDGGAPLIEMGFCISENVNPSLSDTKLKVPSIKGGFNGLFENLKENTTYYVRSYAQNIKGITYGNQISFITKLGNRFGLSSLNNSLRLYLPFNGNANDVSEFSAKSNVFGATLTRDRFENENSAYYFDGVNNMIVFSDKPQFNFGQKTDFSISCFVNMDDWMGKGYEGILTKGGNGIMYQIGRYGNKLSGEYGNPNFLMFFPSLETPNFLLKNKWYSLIMTVNRNSNTIKLYLNGELVKFFFDERVSTQNITSNDPLRIGTERLSAYFFHGKIDDVGIWGRELSLEEIKYIATH